MARHGGSRRRSRGKRGAQPAAASGPLGTQAPSKSGTRAHASQTPETQPRKPQGERDRQRQDEGGRVRRDRRDECGRQEEGGRRSQGESSRRRQDERRRKGANGHRNKGQAEHKPAEPRPKPGMRRGPARNKAAHRGCDHVFFIGFLGAGKTTVARNLGNMFHRRFIDVDHMVERELHATVTRIFATEGEEAFRDAETRALESLRERRGMLVSCGGGVIERPENMRIMHEMGHVVFLDGTLEDSLRQIRRPDKRPDLGDREHARALYAHRRPLYEKACDYRVKISGKSFEQVAYEVGELLWERGLL